jgi:hypothetical protein
MTSNIHFSIQPYRSCVATFASGVGLFIIWMLSTSLKTDVDALEFPTQFIPAQPGTDRLFGIPEMLYSGDYHVGVERLIPA